MHFPLHRRYRQPATSNLYAASAAFLETAQSASRRIDRDAGNAVLSWLVRKRWRLNLLGVLLFALIIVSCALAPSPLWPLILLIVVGIGLWALCQPSFALLLVFAGAGLPSLLLPLPGHTMRPVEPALLLCLLVALLRRPLAPLRLSHLLALFFLAIAFISFIHVPQVASALNAYGADKRLYGVVLLVLAFLCGTWLTAHVKRPISLLLAALLVNLPLFFITLAQALGIMLPTLLEDSSAQNPAQTLGRLWGPFDGAVTLGLYLTNLFAIALSCWLLGTRRRERIIGALMTIACTAAIFGSGTRSAAFAVGLMLVMALLMTRHRRWLLAIGIIVAGALLLFPGPLLARFAHDASSTDNRLFLAQVALNLIGSHPWIGIGLQQFPTYYAQLIVSQATQLNPQGISVHNQYLELALESGVFWLLSGVLFLLSIGYTCWHSYWSARRQKQRERQVLALAALLACAATMLTGFFDVPLDKVEGSVFLFLLVGLALGYTEDNCRHYTGARPAAWMSGRWWHLPTKRREEDTRRVKAQGATTVPATDGSAIGSYNAANGKRTGRSVIVQLLSWGLAVPIIFPTTALLARYLGPARYGEYSATLPFLAIFALLTCTGMDPLLVRNLSLQPRRQWRVTLSYAAGTRLLTTLLSVGMAVIVTLLLPLSAEQRRLFLLGSVTLFFSYSFNGLRTVFEHGFRAEEHITPVALLEVSNRIITAALTMVVVLAHWPFTWIYVLMLYSDLPFCLLLIWRASRRYGLRPRFNLHTALALLRASLPLNGYNVMMLLSAQFDMLALTLLSGARDVGWYALASRITDPLLAPVLAYAGGLYPLFCKTFATGRWQFAQVYSEAVRILALLTLPLLLLLCSQAGALVNLLGGPQFAPATPLVYLLLWAMALTFFNQLAVRACTAVHAEQYILPVTMLSGATNLLLNLLLIPFWQGIGAGIAALLSEGVGFCLLLWLLRCYINPLRIVGTLCMVGIGNLPMLLFLLWQPHLSPLLVISVALSLALLCALCTGSLTRHDLYRFRQLLLRGQQKPCPAAPDRSLAWNSQDVAERTTLILPRVQV